MNVIKKTTAVLIAMLLAAVTLAMVATPAAQADDTGWACPADSIEDNKGKCRKPVADATVCPKNTLGSPGACYIYVDKVLTRTGKVCPAGSIEDNKGDCRKPVADATVCPKNTLGSPGACYIFVNKVLTKVAFGLTLNH